MNTRETKSENEQLISVEKAKELMKKALPHLDQTLLDKNGNPNSYSFKSYDFRFLSPKNQSKTPLETVSFESDCAYKPLKG